MGRSAGRKRTGAKARHARTVQGSAAQVVGSIIEDNRSGGRAAAPADRGGKGYRTPGRRRVLR